MGSWYTIGLCLGIGLGLGLLLAGILGSGTLGASAATLLATAAGATAGVLIGDTVETIAGGVTGFLGAVCATAVAAGALRRGATRLGIAAYLGMAGMLVGLVALIPLLGYLEAIGVPLLAARLRGRQAARFAGLRTLAK